MGINFRTQFSIEVKKTVSPTLYEIQEVNRTQEAVFDGMKTNTARRCFAVEFSNVVHFSGISSWQEQSHVATAYEQKPKSTSETKHQPQRTRTRMMAPKRTMSKCLVLFSAIPWLIIGILLAYSSSPTLSNGRSGLRFSNTNSFDSESVSPFSPSWGSWWHPHSQTTQRVYDPNKWNLLYHLGGYGPWIELREGLVTAQNVGIGPPEGCIVDSVHMVLLSSIPCSHSHLPFVPLEAVRKSHMLLPDRSTSRRNRRVAPS